MPEQFKVNSSAEESVNLLEKDNDPRKKAYVLKLALESREYWHTLASKKDEVYTPMIFRLHKAEGLMEKKPGGERKHMTPEHILTVMAGCVALARRLKLDEKDSRDLLLGATVHDVNKDIEYQLVRNSVDDPKTGYGQRGYDMAGVISKQKLGFAGVPRHIIELSAVPGHAACPDIEKMLKEKSESLSPHDIEKLVLHYIDDIVTNLNIIDPSITTDEKGNALNALDQRCIQNENNPVYKNFNQAWKTDPRNKTGETAFEMQRRVGHLVEGKLAGVENPLTLPEVIHKQMQNDILEHWRKNRKEE